MLDERKLAHIRREAVRASQGLGQPAPSPYSPMTLEDVAWMDGLHEYEMGGESSTEADECAGPPLEERLSRWGPGTEDEQFSLF